MTTKSGSLKGRKRSQSEGLCEPPHCLKRPKRPSAVCEPTSTPCSTLAYGTSKCTNENWGILFTCALCVVVLWSPYMNIVTFSV